MKNYFKIIVGCDGCGECAMSPRIPLLKNDRIDLIDRERSVGGTRFGLLIDLGIETE